MILVFKMLIDLLDCNFKQLLFIFTCFLAASFIDLIGLAMFIPIVSIFLSNDNLAVPIENPFLQGLLAYNDGLNLDKFVLLLIFIFLMKAIVTVLVQMIIVSFVQEQRVILGTKMFGRYLSLGSGIKKQREADQIYNLQTLTSHYTIAIQSILKFANDLMISFAVIAILIFVDVKTFIFVVGLLSLLIFTYLSIVGKLIKNYGRKSNDNMADALRISSEGIRGVDEIRFIGKTGYFLKNYTAALRHVKKASVAIEIHGIMPRILIEMGIIIVMAAALLMVSKSVTGFENFALVFGIYAVSIVRLVPIMSSIATSVTRFRFVQNSIERIHRDVFENIGFSKGQITEVKTVNAEEPVQSIVFENVSFQYDETWPVISDISLSIKKGDIIGLFGPSGSGKSTFIRLVLGLLHPTRGKILYNGKTKANGAIPENMGFAYIPQDAVMLNSSVLENVTLKNDNDDETRQKVRDFLKQVQLGEVLTSLSNGLDEEVGDFGARFSAGQKQRLAFARMLAHDSSFFILDEATNALDMKTEKLLMKHLIKNNVIGTALIVSHRPSTLTDCDYILDFSSQPIRIIDDPKTFVSDRGIERYASK